MRTDNLNARDPYAIAAALQRDPNFGWDTQGGPVLRRHLACASIFSRFSASIIDGVATLIGSLLIFLFAYVGFARLCDEPTEGTKTAVLLGTMFITLAFLWFYNVSQETSDAQATLGKRVTGIKVANLSGGRITVFQSTVRMVSKSILGCHAVVGVIGLLLNLLCLVMNSSTNRALHDLIARTIVISD